MTESRDWMHRVEERRRAQGLSVQSLARRLGVTRTTYYNWQREDQPRPRDSEVIAHVATFLGEDPAALGGEMGRPDLPSYASFVEAAAAREFSVRLYQGHVRAMAHAIGLPDGAPRHEGVDVVCRLLRDRLSARALVGALPVRRGTRRTEPYQYQIYVLPEELGGDSDDLDPDLVLDGVRDEVDEVLRGLLLPVTREHSTELAMPLLRGRADLLIHPGLLDMRTPPAIAADGPPDLLVVGVYYSGAPDVGALLASELGHGFSTIEILSRLVHPTGLRGLPESRFREATSGIARTILSTRSTTGPMVWATDDPRLLRPLAGLGPGGAFEGRVVVLLLSEDALDYAAHRVALAEAEPGLAVEARWRAELARLQDELVAITGTSGEVLTHVVDLPPDVVRGSDGRYPDAVHALFDRYDDVAALVRATLHS